MNKILIFGAGKQYSKMRNNGDFLFVKVVGIVDNDEAKQGNLLDSIKIDSPRNIAEYSYDYILLACASKNVPSITAQLEELGVKKEKIILSVFSILQKGIFHQRFDVPKAQVTANKKAVIFSHDMGLSGAPIALQRFCRTLSELSWEVSVIATGERALIFDFVENSFPVDYYNAFDFTYDEMAEMVKGYDLIVVNTCALRGLIKLLPESVPTIWWLHENEQYYLENKVLSDQIFISENVHAAAVGRLAAEAFKKCTLSEPMLLPYMVDDCYKENSPRHDKTIFALVGSVNFNKGHDIMSDILKEMDVDLRDKFEFWFVGNISDETREKYKDVPCLKIIGEVDHDELMELYRDIDVLVCVSRSDTLPTCVTEAMMMSKCCIVSDNVGSSDYIEPYHNGLLCDLEDRNTIVESLKWVINNRNKLDEIGDRARDTYLHNFSANVFKENVKKVLETVMRQESK